MQSHKLTIRIDGKLARDGKLDSADIPDVTMGVKRLLATQAHYYTEGTVPRNTETNTKYFRMTGGAPGRPVPWTFDSYIYIEGSEVFDVGKYTFKDHFQLAVKAWRDGAWFEVPEFVMLQPTLSIASKQNSAIFSNAAPLRAELLRLSERTSQAFDLVTRPLGGSASSLQMLLDDAIILAPDRRSRDWEISEYVRRLKSYERRQPDVTI